MTEKTTRMEVLEKYGARFIPLRKNQKIPSTSFKDKEFSKEYLANHIKRGGNIALLCQPKFVFVDIDTKENHGSDGLTNFLKWIKKIGLKQEEVLNTLMAKTPSGGMHLVYLLPNKYRIRQDISFLPGVDIKASPNNYIVVAPSTIDGKPYRWVDENVDPKVLPIKMANSFVDNVRKLTNKKLDDNFIDVETGVKYIVRNNYPVVDVFNIIKNGFGTKGNRNNTLYRWAYSMSRVTDEDTCLEVALLVNKKTNPPIPQEELTKSIKSAFNSVHQLETIEIQDKEWVELKHVPSNMEKLVVSKEDYHVVKSLDFNKYKPEQIYIYNNLDTQNPLTNYGESI